MSADPFWADAPNAELAAKAVSALDALAEAARRITGAQVCAIMSLDGDDLVTQTVASKTGDVAPGARFPAYRGVAGWTLASCEPVAIRHIDGRPDLAEDLIVATGHVPDSVAIVPILHDETALGVIEILDGTVGNEISDFELLTSFADQAGVLLHDLYEASLAAPSARVPDEVIEGLSEALQSATPDAQRLALTLLTAAREALGLE